MANRRLNPILPQFRRAVLLPDGAGLSDGQLLAYFVEQREEAAFEALVRRHGPMVLGLCRRILGNPHDAEDAFQATFLVLVRKANAIVPRERVANWLYGVAYRAALKARATATRRRAREKQVPELPEPAAPPHDLGRDLQPVLDKELSRLPDKYRVPVVLCDLEGKPLQEAAHQLGWPLGTLAGRLARARTRLAKRLTQRGVALSAGALTAVLAANAASAGVPLSLVGSTVKAASALAAGQAAATGAISAPVAALMEGVLRSMLLSKLKYVSVVLLIGGVVCAGAAVSGRLLSANAQQTESVARSAPEAVQAEKPKPEAADRPKEGRAPEGAERESRLKALLKERLALLKQAAAEMEQAFQAGTVSAHAFMQAQRAVFQAELELCETDKERLVVHEKSVALAKDIEQAVEKQFEAGRVPRSFLLTAKAERLEAEIALERTKVKAAAPAK
jgi:RNA polymerase sigma-70 factor (ECF subfamily)